MHCMNIIDHKPPPKRRCLEDLSSGSEDEEKLSKDAVTSKHVSPTNPTSPAHEKSPQVPPTSDVVVMVCYYTVESH